jgi:hypothetical protein
MKLGEGGEAFFVFETSDDIPAALQTSPLMSPASSPDSLSNAKATPEIILQEPEFLDLGDGLTVKRPEAVGIKPTDSMGTSEAQRPQSLIGNTFTYRITWHGALLMESRKTSTGTCGFRSVRTPDFWGLEPGRAPDTDHARKVCLRGTSIRVG